MNISLKLRRGARDEESALASRDGEIFISEEGLAPVRVGQVSLVEIYPEDAEDLWGEMDGWSDQAAELYGELFPGGYLADAVSEAYECFLDDVALLEHIRIDPAYRNRGIGTVALGKVVDFYLRRNNFALLLIKPFGSTEDHDWSQANTRRLRKFYERLGFRMVTENYMAYSLFNQEQPSIEEARTIRAAAIKEVAA